MIFFYLIIKIENIDLETSLVGNSLDVIMNFVLQRFLWILGIQYTSGRTFSLLRVLNPNFFECSTFSSTVSNFLTFDLAQVFFSYNAYFFKVVSTLVALTNDCCFICCFVNWNLGKSCLHYFNVFHDRNLFVM